MTNKLCKAFRNTALSSSTVIIIIKESPSPSDLIDELQYWLYCTSVRVDLFKGSKPLIEMLRKMLEIFDNKLPTLLHNLIFSGIIQLLQQIIVNHTKHLTLELIEAACNVWLLPEMKSTLEHSTQACIYEALITITFIESLGTTAKRYNKLRLLIVSMIRKEIISFNYVKNLFITLSVRHKWHPPVQKQIAKMLQIIEKGTGADYEENN